MSLSVTGRRLRGWIGAPAFWAISVRALGLAGSLLLSIAIMRALPAEDAGYIVLGYIVLNLAAMFSRFGSDTVCLIGAAQDAAMARTLIRNSAVLTIILTPAAIAAVLGLMVWRGGGTGEGWGVGAALALGVLPAALAVTAAALLRGLGSVVIGSFVDLGAPALLSATGVAALAASGFATPVGVAWIISASYALTSVWAAILIRRRLPELSHPDRGFIHFVSAQGQRLTAFFANSAGFFLLAWMPVFALEFGITDPARAHVEVAEYNAAVRLAQLVSVVSVVQVAYLSQRFAVHYQRGEIQVVNALAQRASLMAGTWAASSAAFLIVSPNFFLALFGDYSTAATGLRILATAALVVAALGPVNGLMVTCGLERQAGVYTAALVSSSAVLLLTLSRFGHVGVAAGFGCVSIAYAAICARALHKVGVHAVRPLSWRSS